MPIYKKNGFYKVKISVKNKQVLRRTYLGLPILDLKTAQLCEKDLFLEYGETQLDYHINDLFNLFEDYFYKTHKVTSAKRCMYDFNKNIKSFFVDKNISDIKSGYLELVNDRLNMLPKISTHCDIYLCKTFLAFLGSYGYKGGTNKIYNFKKSRKVKKNFAYYTLDEFKVLFDVIDSNFYKLLFSLLFYYGLRVGELKALTYGDFKQDRVSINKQLTSKARFSGQYVLDCKTTSSNRDYPYVANIRDLYNIFLLDHKKHKSSEFIFKLCEDKVVGDSTIRRALARYCSLCNLKVIKIHEFRHSCATYLVKKI